MSKITLGQFGMNFCVSGKSHARRDSFVMWPKLTASVILARPFIPIRNFLPSKPFSLGNGDLVYNNDILYYRLELFAPISSANMEFLLKLNDPGRYDHSRLHSVTVFPTQVLTRDTVQFKLGDKINFDQENLIRKKPEY